MRRSSIVLTGVLLLFTASFIVAQEQKQQQSQSFVGRVISGLFGSSQTTTKQAKERRATRSAPAVQEAPVNVSRPQVQDVDDQSTHEQVALIKCVNDKDESLQVNAFCLHDGKLLAACGNGPGEVRVYTGDGEFVTSWEVPVKPESINAGMEGTLLVAGNGKLFQFTSDGQLVREAEAPHAAAIRENAGAIRKEVEEQANRRSQVYEQQIEIYQQQIEQLRTKDELSKADKQRLEAFERTITQMEKLRDRYRSAKLSDEQVEQQVKASTDRKMRVASISTDGSSIYVATPAMTGYGFAVWRMDQDFSGGEEIVTGLRGCCGQMDVQACSNGIFVAENSRHRVVSYDADGKELTSWGKRDRKGVDGFSSCCNPMNVAFGPGGDVYTAESSTGRIKRFSQKGEFLEYVGDVKLVPGCKNVSIAVSEDGGHVYMLDITRNHIIVMKRKAQTDKAAEVAAAGAAS